MDTLVFAGEAGCRGCSRQWPSELHRQEGQPRMNLTEWLWERSRPKPGDFCLTPATPFLLGLGRARGGESLLRLPGKGQNSPGRWGGTQGGSGTSREVWGCGILEGTMKGAATAAPLG